MLIEVDVIFWKQKFWYHGTAMQETLETWSHHRMHSMNFLLISLVDLSNRARNDGSRSRFWRLSCLHFVELLYLRQTLLSSLNDFDSNIDQKAPINDNTILWGMIYRLMNICWNFRDYPFCSLKISIFFQWKTLSSARNHWICVAQKSFETKRKGSFTRYRATLAVGCAIYRSLITTWFTLLIPHSL